MVNSFWQFDGVVTGLWSMDNATATPDWVPDGGHPRTASTLLPPRFPVRCVGEVCTSSGFAKGGERMGGGEVRRGEGEALKSS